MTGLVDTLSVVQLLRMIASGRLHPPLFATYRFALGGTTNAHDQFAGPANPSALNVVLSGAERPGSASARVAEPAHARPRAGEELGVRPQRCGSPSY